MATTSTMTPPPPQPNGTMNDEWLCIHSFAWVSRICVNVKHTLDLVYHEHDHTINAISERNGIIARARFEHLAKCVSKHWIQHEQEHEMPKHFALTISLHQGCAVHIIAMSDQRCHCQATIKFGPATAAICFERQKQTKKKMSSSNESNNNNRKQYWNHFPRRIRYASDQWSGSGSRQCVRLSLVHLHANDARDATKSY